MQRLNYKQTIADAWHFTQVNKRLITWYAYTPAFLSTIVGIAWVLYQYFSFKKSHLFTDTPTTLIFEIFEFIADAISSSAAWAWPLVIFASIIGLLYLTVPSFFRGGLVQIIARKRNNQDIRIRDGIGFCFKSFLALFGYHLITSSFSVLSLFSTAALVLKVVEIETFKLFIVPFILILIFDLIVAVLFTYSHLFIIIDEEGIFSAMAKSSSLVMMHWQNTLLITILMLIIGARIVLNLVLILAIPILVVSTAGLFATFSGTQIGFILGGFIGLIAMVFAAYLSAIIQVFAASVWTFTFLQLSHKDVPSARDVA